jgi:hypothetical protein
MLAISTGWLRFESCCPDQHIAQKLPVRKNAKVNTTVNNGITSTKPCPPALLRDRPKQSRQRPTCSRRSSVRNHRGHMRMPVEPCVCPASGPVPVCRSIGGRLARGLTGVGAASAACPGSSRRRCRRRCYPVEQQGLTIGAMASLRARSFAFGRQLQARHSAAEVVNRTSQHRGALTEQGDSSIAAHAKQPAHPPGLIMAMIDVRHPVAAGRTRAKPNLRSAEPAAGVRMQKSEAEATLAPRPAGARPPRWGNGPGASR